MLDDDHAPQMGADQWGDIADAGGAVSAVTYEVDGACQKMAIDTHDGEDSL
jgi:hypothetical protein